MPNFSPQKRCPVWVGSVNPARIFRSQLGEKSHWRCRAIGEFSDRAIFGEAQPARTWLRAEMSGGPLTLADSLEVHFFARNQAGSLLLAPLVVSIRQSVLVGLFRSITPSRSAETAQRSQP